MSIGVRKGYIVAATNRAAINAAEEAGWVKAKGSGLVWITQNGDRVRLTPDGNDFSDLSSRRVCYFVPGWENRCDAVEIAYGLGMSGCETYWISGEKLALDAVFVRRVAKREAS